MLYSQFGESELNLFVRFAEQLKQKGATVAAACTEPARPLVSSITWVDEALSPEESIENLDCRVPVEYLPGLLEIPAPEAPGSAPYFHPNPLRTEHWRKTIGNGEKRKIGIMWRKESDQRPDVFHSVPLDAFAPLAELDNIELFSIQVTCGKEELEDCNFKEKPHHLNELENADLAERLAAAAGLDLLISADSFTAQAASASGLPVWMLVSAAPEWYFGLREAQSPWLPSARLFRQSVVGQWNDVMKAVVEALETWTPSVT